MNFQPCRATGKPGTCKWCGRVLVWATDVERKSERPTRSKCCKAAVNDRGDCSECHEFVPKIDHIVNRKVHYSKPGYYGDGHFCGLSCGYQFGIVQANAGRTLTPRAVDA